MKYLRYPLFALALWLGFLISLNLAGGSLQPARAQSDDPCAMGDTHEIRPGQTFLPGSQKQLNVLGGWITDPPAGMVPWIPPGKKKVWECASKYMELNGSCSDGVVYHYWNPTTGEHCNILIKGGKFKSVPDDNSQGWLHFGATNAAASIGESINFGGGIGSITVLDITPLDNTAGVPAGTAIFTISIDATGSIGYVAIQGT